MLLLIAIKEDIVRRAALVRARVRALWARWRG
jgi:hypothetical protein